MEKKRFPKLFTMDSDVLLFENVSIDSKNYEKCDFTISQGACAHVNFLNNKKVLSEYYNLVIKFYQNKSCLIDYTDGCTITDMSFWKHLALEGNFKVGELTTIVSNSVYDAALLTKQNDIEMKGGIKYVSFKGGLPFGKTKTGMLRLKCLHCQGPTKFYMKYFVIGKVGFFSSIKIFMMMGLRDNISPVLPKEVRDLFKKFLSVLGF
jgi:hypothetical protein